SGPRVAGAGVGPGGRAFVGTARARRRSGGGGRAAATRWHVRARSRTRVVGSSRLVRAVPSNGACVRREWAVDDTDAWGGAGAAAQTAGRNVRAAVGAAGGGDDLRRGGNGDNA